MYKKVISLCTIILLLLQTTTYAAASDIGVSSTIDENILTETLLYQDDLQKAMDNASKDTANSKPQNNGNTQNNTNNGNTQNTGKPDTLDTPTTPGGIVATSGAIEAKRAQLQKDITANTYLNYIKDLGYYKKTSKTDEKLNIRNAILLFQSNHNMSVTGSFDEKTKQMLISRLLSSKFSFNDKVNKAPTDSTWIVVNKTTRVLTLYKGTTPIKKYAVAVGNPSSLTKSGKYNIVSKLINPDWGGGGFAKPVKGGIPENPLGSRWIGINRTDGSYGIHGTNSFYSIGKYISHGCIRMQNYCVEELFSLVSVKSFVWVGTADELKKWGIVQNQFTLSN